MKNIRIASGAGFWGDWLEAPLRQVQLGPIDYLVSDYLAELTMSILARQYQKDSAKGYAYDFVSTTERILKDIAEKDIKVISNAGGINPMSCANLLKSKAEELGLKDQVKIAVVSGDNITDTINDAIAANVYLGSAPIVEALKGGANIIITGRVADAALALAPMIYEFAWNFDDWDKLALGTIAGHVIECGAQASGGNCSFDWQSIPDLANIGYPIIEINENLDCYITKHEGTGGRVDLASVKEQLVYEIGDPENYITPDVIADFTSISLKEVELNKVQIFNAKGKPASEQYKVSVCYANGYKAESSLIYTEPDVEEKVKCAEEIIRERLASLDIDQISFENIGLNACHGELASSDSKPSEIMFRVAVRDKDYNKVKRFTKELVPLVLSGPPSVSGYTGGSKVVEIYSYSPIFVDKNSVNYQVDYL